MLILQCRASRSHWVVMLHVWLTGKLHARAHTRPDRRQTGASKAPESDRFEAVIVTVLDARGGCNGLESELNFCGGVQLEFYVNFTTRGCAIWKLILIRCIAAINSRQCSY